MRLRHRAAFVVAASLAAAAHGDSVRGPEPELEDLDFCGPARVVSAFEFERQGHTYTFPYWTRIERDGKVVTDEGLTETWHLPYHGILHAEFGKYVLVEIFWQDCVDIWAGVLYVLEEGRLLTRQPMWTSHHRQGFFDDDGTLTFWSEWFCNDLDEQRRGDLSYVYVFDPERQEFVRRDVPEADYCPDLPEREFIEFRPATERE